MKIKVKTAKLTYKTLFGYSLVVIALLLVAVPVFANTTPGSRFLDFSIKSTVGKSPQNAQPLTPGVNLSHLNPGEEDWYVYSRDMFEDNGLSWISLAMRYESEALIGPDQINFEVLVQPQDTGWFQDSSPQEVLGAGLRSPLRAASNTVEAFWTGRVAPTERYFVRVFNQSPFGIDYTLEARAEQPAVSGATPASFRATAGSNEALNARQLAWTLTAQAVENMSADQAAAWMQEAQAVGWIVTTATPISSAPNPAQADPQTLWRLTAQAIEGQSAEAAARWLLQADSLGWLAIPLSTLKNPNPEDPGGPTGGGDNPPDPPAEPIPPDEAYTPVNIYPNNPLEFDFNHVNSGRLPPYGEHWYSLIRDDFDDDPFEDLKLTMFFTPRVGYTSNRINFEIIPASQYHIWERGDADYLTNIGAGMWVSRDEDPNTGERLWSGTLVDGDRYFIKVKNGTADVVDYYLFPNDVENAELGNPTLHRAGISGRIPYQASPPTRPGPPPEPGSAPTAALPLKVGQVTAALDAGEERWYRFSFGSGGEKSVPRDFEIYLTTTPQDDIRARHADFAIYPGSQLHIWMRGDVDRLKPLGTSSVAFDQSGDPRSLRVVWDGQLMSNHTYYIKVYNHDIGPLEYELEVKQK
ncbi:MAG: hypothetical protein D6784_13745 [Chloroflexi bacterium]|nr:MAG: hypothetical protein D6784_13745 [Chloroflexota bacterium]